MKTDLFGDEPKDKPKKRVGYIDADIIAYKACCAGNKSIIFGSGDDEDCIEVNDFKTVVDIFHDAINNIVYNYNLDEYYLCFSHKDNFRKKVIPYYKANRTQEKPMHLKRIINYAKENYNCLEHAGLEGDDVCGIYCTVKPKIGETRIGISIDKDFKTLPIVFINLSEENEIKISWLDSFRNLCIQVLMGDGVDGYHGIKGFGKVKSARVVDKLIINATNMYPYGSSSFISHVISGIIKVFEDDCERDGGGEYMCNDDGDPFPEKYFWQMLQVAYILRDGDYDIEKKKVRLITHNNFTEMLKAKY